MITITITVRQMADQPAVGISVQTDQAQLATATMHEKQKAVILIESVKAGMKLAGDLEGEATILGVGLTMDDAVEAALKQQAARKGRN